MSDNSPSVWQGCLRKIRHLKYGGALKRLKRLKETQPEKYKDHEVYFCACQGYHIGKSRRKKA